MRTTIVAIAFLLGAAAPAFAEARILNVDDPEPAPAEAAPAPIPEPQSSQAQPVPTPAPESQPPAAAKEAVAPPPPPALPPSRFTFERSKDGFLRLDRETGQVAYCSGRAAGWACDAVPEERTALEKEIVRLQDEVAGLKREVAALREPPPPPRPPAELAPRPPASKDGNKDGDLTIKLPTQADIDRATAALQRAWDRVVDMIGNLKNDLTRKTQPDRTTL
jgi:hypothetical protein